MTTAKANVTSKFQNHKPHGLLQVARSLNVPRLLLCSTDDPIVKTTWRHLGFVYTSQEDLENFGVQHGDLVHMDNTVQMHKDVPLAREWRSLVVRLQDLRQRVYFPAQPYDAAHASTAYHYKAEPVSASARTNGLLEQKSAAPM